MNNQFVFIWNLGYRRLCPVIPPDAPLDPESKIARRVALGKSDPRGKAPGVRRHNGLWTGYDFVHAPDPSAKLAAEWQEMGASVGIKTGKGLLAIDIDVLHPETSSVMQTLAEHHMGPAPIRYGRWPKALMLYRITDDVPYERVSFSTPDEDKAAVEILYEGRQFVAAGVHPATGKPYDWRGTLTKRENLTETTPMALAAFMAAVAERMPAARRSIGHEGEVPPQDKLLGDPELVRQAVAALPNTSALYPDRQDYLRVGYAIRAAMGPEHQGEALDLYAQWAGRWDEGSNDEVDDDWGRMPGPYLIGAEWLYGQAEKHGGWEGRMRSFFQPVDEAAVAAELGLTPASHPLVGPDGKKRFEMLSLDEVMRLPDPRFMVDRHIPETGLGFLYSRPGAGKSFLCIDLSLHIAYGLTHWHGDALRCRPGANVLYIAREGSAGFKARIRAWQSGRDLPEGANFSMIRQTINFTLQADIDALVRTVRDAGLGALDLIVVDTVSRAIPGADENLQKDMSIFVAACDALVETFQCVVLGVHHAGKSGDLRGSSVLRGAGDFVFRLDREAESRTGRLWCEKMKDAPDGWSEAYRFVEVEGSLVPFRVSPEEDEALSAGAEERVLRAMHEAWEAGVPWSKSSNTASAKGGRVPRYGPLLAGRLLGVSATLAEEIIASLAHSGLIEHAALDRKMTGWRVISPLPIIAGDIFG